MAPDFLTGSGGTPANEDKAREMIGTLDMAAAVADGVATLAFLQRHKKAGGRVGVTGFCWGGAMVNRLSVAAGSALGSGVSFYGPAPDPAEAPKVQAPVMLHLAGLDQRVNQTALPWAEALKAAGKTIELHVYEGVNHAFHNDTSAERYDAAAAQLAWDRTITFFRRHRG
jgi:carboxymethylenebutenolidase